MPSILKLKFMLMNQSTFNPEISKISTKTSDASFLRTNNLDSSGNTPSIPGMSTSSSDYRYNDYEDDRNKKEEESLG